MVLRSSLSTSQRQDQDTTRPCHLQPRPDRRLPSSHLQRGFWRRLDRCRPNLRRLLPPRRLQVRRLRVLQATIHQLPWLRDRLPKPYSRLPRIRCRCRVLRRHCPLPARSDPYPPRLRTHIRERPDWRLQQDPEERGRRRFLLWLRPHPLQAGPIHHG